MIKHIVMFKLKPEAEGKTAAQNAQEAKSRAEAFVGQIPTLRRIEVVRNMEGAQDSNCEIALLCEFDTMAGLEAYRVHPVHVAFGAYITPLRESRACIDYEF